MSSVPKSTTKETEPKLKTQRKDKRDDFKDSVRNTLRQRAGDRCCLCRKPTSGPGTDPNKAYNIGEAAHITAAAEGGPRYDKDMKSDVRSSAENGIWLCCNCHKKVDSDEIEYTVEKLKQLKKEGEEQARKAFGDPEPNISAHTPDECIKFSSYVKKVYIERRNNHEKQWPPCHSNKLMRLELVKRKKREDHSAKQQRGKEDRYGGSKDKAVRRTPLPYGDLFKGKSEIGKRPVRKVLVEGDAGIGKTTLCIAVSEDWANQELFQQFELVLHLPLRMKAIASVGSFAELLKLLHPNPRLCNSVARYLEEEEGRSVLIIADGWDELSESDRQEGSFLYQLLFNSMITVVVTSRPSASALLRELPDIDRFVEVHGFSKEHIVKYIQSEFASDQENSDQENSDQENSDQENCDQENCDEEKADRLLEQLEYNPLIESVCSVPLNCAIICHLWRMLEEALPATMTELYTKIILSFVLRNMCKTDAYKSVSSLTNFESLPADLKQSWWRLCRFAFYALEKDQLVFSQEELEASGLALDKCVQVFGILQQTELVGVGVSFHFLHLTFQEYLAALHLARQTTDEQSKFFQTHKLKFLSSVPHRFGMVWRFFFGINSSKFNEDTNSFIEQSLKCVAGDNCVFPDNLSVCHCAFEANSDFINNNVAKYLVRDSRKNTIDCGCPRSAFDCSAILHVIANMKECSDRLDVKLKYASENQIKILLDMKGKLEMIVALDLSYSRLTVSGLLALEGLVRDQQLAALERIELAGCYTSDAEANSKLVTALLDNNCPNLECFHLSSPSDIDASWIEIEIDDYNRILSIGNLDDEDLTSLIESVGELSVFHYVSDEFVRNELVIEGIHASGVSCLAGVVCSEKVKIDCDLDLRDSPLGLQGAIAVGRMLSSSHCQLSRIYLSNCQLADRLPTDSVSCEGAGQELCQMAETCSSSIERLELDDNSFTGEGIHILAGFMHLCRNVEELSTWHCSITSDDLIRLIDKLVQLKSSFPSLCSKLYRWNLDNNQLDDKGSSVLAYDLPSLFPWCYELSNYPGKMMKTMTTLKEELNRGRERMMEEKYKIRKVIEEVKRRELKEEVRMQSSEDSDNNDDSDDSDDSEDSSNQQASLMSSLVALNTQPTVIVIQQSPSDQRAQVRREEQQTQPMITQQQLAPQPHPPAGTDQHTVGTTQQQLPPPLSGTDQYNVRTSYLPSLPPGPPTGTDLHPVRTTGWSLPPRPPTGTDLHTLLSTQQQLPYWHHVPPPLSGTDQYNVRTSYLPSLPPGPPADTDLRPVRTTGWPLPPRPLTGTDHRTVGTPPSLSSPISQYLWQPEGQHGSSSGDDAHESSDDLQPPEPKRPRKGT